MSAFHNPVLLEETLALLVKEIDGIYIDSTFGGGGHSFSVLKKISNKGKLIALDQDIDSINNNNIFDARFNLVKSNFRFLQIILKKQNINYVSGILADLGISSHQINTSKRGFSIRYDSLLDMRMDHSQKKNAKFIINNYSYNKLYNILIKYGEVKNAKKIANIILKQRKKKIIKTTFELKNLLACFFNFKTKLKNKFLSKIFQSIRIEVNDEINALKDLLNNSLSILKHGGRIAIISYHSLEDRIVKKFFKTGNFHGVVKYDLYGNNLSPLILLEPRVIFTSKKEIKQNNRSRSARLRIAEKKFK
ncbi:16S rRNA (cytosine(1402)-N(4))-methyltransferase RsmH [Candidatus Karelsulcia muelleri]|uniref:16S rRNA (cytosine(1402)-N(4))-methyltransferase RsmH n=1 Tax=Candidatus Karelsulcia muelleri TaxID=336810 RepID=UPI000D7C6B13|nr:16S rRNA (cytosine(1402)-N(4))-methyltransferase RsmH [Candidatus Karelsulcia muelleri]